MRVWLFEITSTAFGKKKFTFDNRSGFTSVGTKRFLNVKQRMRLTITCNIDWAQVRQGAGRGDQETVPPPAGAGTLPSGSSPSRGEGCVDLRGCCCCCCCFEEVQSRAL